ncbi:PREDICTED: uncharacterized protein LOC108793976 [Nanorana parkeri]|uniref:uncharacterized protein LOC108793976 n=1 Tax=Nanorana parkeri TaxID=125878 RepID=UPI000854F20D|nr:PREDICTED: uncharacterized protein LOC108793976 [Nanorana parkeri]
MRRPGDECGAGARGRERRRHRGGARVTWDVIRGPQDLLMGRRGTQEGLCDDRAEGGTEGGNGSYSEGAEEEDEIRDLQEAPMSDERSPRSSERGSVETISGCIVHSGSQHGTGSLQEEKAYQGLTRSYTSEEKYWGKDSGEITSLEVASGHQDMASGHQDMASDCSLGDIRSESQSDGERIPEREDIVHQEPANVLQYMSNGSEVKDHKGGCNESHPRNQGEAEKHLSEKSQLDGQVFQKRQRKNKGSKEKKRSRANGVCREQSIQDGQQRMEASSFQELYRGLSVEEEDTQQDAEAEASSEGGSRCFLSGCRTEAAYVRVSEKELRQDKMGPEISWNKAITQGCDGRGSGEEALFSPKDQNGLLEIMKSHKGGDLENKGDYSGSSEVYSSYRSEFRSPGNGSSGSGEGTEMEQGNYHGACREVSYDLGRYERDCNCEMEDKNFNPLTNHHIEPRTWVCSSPSHDKPVNVEDRGNLEEVGTWCWCLHLYLGDTKDTSHGENEIMNDDEERSKECGYSLRSTLRAEERPDGHNGRDDGDIPEPLTKKGGRVVDTPELQDWVNWWQGWAGSCRAVPGHRRGARTQILGCRGEARAERQKQQDVWVLREWTKGDSGRRGGGQKVSGGDVWVLRNQEAGKQGSAWPLGEEDIWVPREPRKPRGAYFVTDNAKWGPHSAKPGVSDKGES